MSGKDSLQYGVSITLLNQFKEILLQRKEAIMARANDQQVPGLHGEGIIDGINTFELHSFEYAEFKECLDDCLVKFYPDKRKLKLKMLNHELALSEIFRYDTMETFYLRTGYLLTPKDVPTQEEYRTCKRKIITLSHKRMNTEIEHMDVIMKPIGYHDFVKIHDIVKNMLKIATPTSSDDEASSEAVVGVSSENNSEHYHRPIEMASTAGSDEGDQTVPVL